MEWKEQPGALLILSGPLLSIHALRTCHPQIDTEGFDATVIMGAMESIARGRIGVISFEYHEVGVWREYSLRQVVSSLDGFGYVW